MTVDERLLRLERMVRMQWMLLAIVVAACVVSVFMATRRYTSMGWTTDPSRRGTFGASQHVTGATIDVFGLPNDSGGLAVLTSDPTNEAFFLQGLQRPGNQGWMKSMSISSMWNRPAAAAPSAAQESARVVLTRYNSTYLDTKGEQRDDVGMMHCGGHGIVFYPNDSQRVDDCPAEPRTIAINGNLDARKDVHIAGHLFVNGTEIR